MSHLLLLVKIHLLLLIIDIATAWHSPRIRYRLTNTAILAATLAALAGLVALLGVQHAS